MDYPYHHFGFFFFPFFGFLFTLFIGALIGRWLALRRWRRRGGPGPWAYHGGCRRRGDAAPMPPTPMAEQGAAPTAGDAPRSER